MYSTKRFLEFIDQISGQATPQAVIDELQHHVRDGAGTPEKTVPANMPGSIDKDADAGRSDPDSPKATSFPEKSVPADEAERDR